jgi:integrase
VPCEPTLRVHWLSRDQACPLYPSSGCQPGGQPLTAGMTEPPLLWVLRMAGVTRAEGFIGQHDPRHIYGSHLTMRGLALKVIQELMGHATVEMTMRYAHLSPEARERAVQELDRPIPQPRAALG